MYLYFYTVFENHVKKSYLGLRAKRATFSNGQKFIKNAKNWQFGEVLKPEFCGQTVVSDRSVLIGQKLVENAKMLSNATF